MLKARLTAARGSILILVAAAIFPFAGMLAFAIDVSHWFDYSRNLQNRADAAALAGGSQYGNVCFNGNAGDQWTGAQAAIGEFAQLYAGPGQNSGVAARDQTTFQGSGGGSPTANNPYSDAAVFGATGANAYKNVPNLKKGGLSKYFVRLNATNYQDRGGTNFSMGDFCTKTPSKDFSDTANPDGPLLDVKVVQHSFGNFIPIFGALGPNIEAHARVQLQGEQSPSDVRPIAVRDAAYTPCVSVNFVNASTNALIKTVTLDKQAQVKNTDPVTWKNNTPTSLTMPANANVYMQAFLNLCNGDGITYDDSTNTGVLYINGYQDPSPAIANGQAPKLASGGSPKTGVTLVNGSCAPDQYFASQFTTASCTETLAAWLEIAPNLSKNDVSFTVVDNESNGVTGTYNLNPPNGPYTAGVPELYTSVSLPVQDTDGINQWEIKWRQTAGSVGGTACGNGNGNNPAPCTGTFGIQQQSFAACDACNQPDDSGPIILAQLSQQGGGNLVNSLQSGTTTNNLVVTLQLAGVSVAKPGDPATVLRFNGGQQTGLVDCGQGNGANQDYDAIYGGCGPNNTLFNPPLPRLYVNARNGVCTQPWPYADGQDCVQTTPGERRTQIPKALVDRMTNNGASCPTNYWQQKINGKTVNYTVDPTSDPRAVMMIITSDVDLALAPNGSQSWIPIRQFATFYVTGWDTKIYPNLCNGNAGSPDYNEPFPVKGKKNLQDGAIWGHWILYTDNTGIPNGTACDTSQLVICVPALTR